MADSNSIKAKVDSKQENRERKKGGEREIERGDAATARTEHHSDQLRSPPGIETSLFSASALARPLLTQNSPRLGTLSDWQV